MRTAMIVFLIIFATISVAALVAFAVDFAVECKKFSRNGAKEEKPPENKAAETSESEVSPGEAINPGVQKADFVAADTATDEEDLFFGQQPEGSVEEENFLTIKHKYKKIAIIAATLLGICCGVLVGFAFLLAYKLTGNSVLWITGIPVGVVSAALCGGLLYLLIRPSDVKIAKKLDRQYNLGQKVQTMVEYRGVEGDLAELQRRQADGALCVAAKKRVNVSFLLKFLFIPVLAIVMLFVGIFVPVKKAAAPVKKDYSSTLIALQNLIDDVNESDLQTPLKENTAAALTALLEDIEQNPEQQESVMKPKVISTVKVVDSLVSSANTYVSVYNAVMTQRLITSYGTQLITGMTYYRDSITEIKSMTVVRKKAELNDNATRSALESWAEEFAGTYNVTGEDGTATSTLLTADEMVAKSTSYGAAFTAALSSASLSESNDGLCEAVRNFVSGITGINYSGLSAEVYKQRVVTYVDAFVDDCITALYVQSYSCIMDDYIRNRMASIFGLSVSDFGSNAPVVNDSSDENGGDDDDDDDGNGGGAGKGEIKYGSDDLVYDPISGEQVPYSELLTRVDENYQDKIDDIAREYAEILNDDEDATEEEKAAAEYYVSELAEYISQYLAKLYKGIEDGQ